MFYSRNTLSQKSREAWKGQRGKKGKQAKEKKCDEKKQTNKQTNKQKCTKKTKQPCWDLNLHHSYLLCDKSSPRPLGPTATRQIILEK